MLKEYECLDCVNKMEDSPECKKMIMPPLSGYKNCAFYKNKKFDETSEDRDTLYD